MPRILVVDDDAKMAEVLAALLARSGHVVDQAHDGEQALFAALTHPPDLMILDLDLPKIDGEEVLQALFDAGAAIPVLVLTGRRTDLSDEVRGLQMGAVDFVRKGTRADVLLARAEAALRRSSVRQPPTITAGRLTVDIPSATLTLDGIRRPVSHRTVRLLLYLISCSRVVSKDEIARALFGGHAALFDHAVEQAVYEARKSLGDRTVIKTIRSRGYQFDGQST